MGWEDDCIRSSRSSCVNQFSQLRNLGRAPPRNPGAEGSTCGGDQVKTETAPPDRPGPHHRTRGRTTDKNRREARLGRRARRSVTLDAGCCQWRRCDTCSFPPRWGTRCVTQALRAEVVHPSGVNIPRNRRRHRSGIGAGSSLSGASTTGDPDLYGSCSIPGRFRCAHISAQELVPRRQWPHERSRLFPPDTWTPLQVPTHGLRGVAEFPAPLTGNPVTKTPGVSLPWAGARSGIVTL